MPSKKEPTEPTEPKDKFLIIKTRAHTRRAANGTTCKYKCPTDQAKIVAAIRYFIGNILLDEGIVGGPDGYYTWLIKRTDSGHQFMVAANTKSKQELGTLHKNLDDFTPGGAAIAAGEFLKEGKTVKFNLQSGTYMAKLFKALKPSKKKGEDKITKEDREKQRELLDNATAAFGRIGLTATFLESAKNAPIAEQISGQPLINAANIITSPTQNAKYKELLSLSESK